MHSRLRFYVPSHVNRDDLDKCLMDSRTDFADVATEQEAIELEAKNSSLFFVLEKDYFTIYNSPEGTVKCNYLSRNYIMYTAYFQSMSFSWPYLVVLDGLKVFPKPPVIQFVPIGFISDMAGGTDANNSVAVYYTVYDIGKFAQMAKEMVGYNQKFFVALYSGSVEYVDMEDINKRVEFSLGDFANYISQISDDPANIGRLMEELRVARENRPRRLPSGQFKLRASCGNDVTDGEQFRLIPESRYAEYLEEEAAADFDTDDSDPKGVEMDYGMVVSHERDSVFTVETIDGIVYLCCGGHYLFCPDDGECLIKMGPELPSKDERLHLEQCGRLIKFSRWNRHGYAYLFGELDIPDAVMLPGLGYPELDEATLKVVLVKV